MILVKIETIRSSSAGEVQLVRDLQLDPRDARERLVEKLDVLDARHSVAESVGGALNSIATGPVEGAKFLVTVLATDVEGPIYDQGGR